MKYICECCGELIDECNVRTSDYSDDNDIYCPQCGEPCLVEAKQCEKCGEWVDANSLDDGWCESCVKEWESERDEN